MSLTLTDALVVVVVIVLLYYVLLKENFDPKVDIFPKYWPPAWPTLSAERKKAWAKGWVDVWNNGMRNAYNNNARAYMIQYAKGNLSRQNNKGPYISVNNREFWKLYSQK